MNLLVSPAEMRAAERSAIERGRSEPDLMRAAAEEITRWLTQHIDRVTHPRAATDNTRQHAVALVGPGNNGSDALVTLALLSASGWRVGAVMLGRDAPGQLPIDSALLANIVYGGIEALDSADIIIDGIFGIGSRTSLPPAVVDAFRVAHTARSRDRTPLIAIDVPSGIDAETGAASDDAFQADATLCLGLPKLGLVREPAASHVGELVVLDIGIAEPEVAGTTGRPRLLSRSVVQQLVPARRASVHKSDAGTLLVVAGAPTYYGAPRLAGAAAMRAGAGLVALAAPASIVPTIATALPELVMLPLAEHDSAESIVTIREFSSARASTLRAAVVGPGPVPSPRCRRPAGSSAGNRAGARSNRPSGTGLTRHRRRRPELDCPARRMAGEVASRRGSADAPRW
jgi:ADP-dependent NAD(P)H-hydrate dehydratase / NAD(P)H-hydrate epimerase